MALGKTLLALYSPDKMNRRAPKRPHVFISYVSENEKAVQHLTECLAENSINVWLDRESIDPGTYWKDAIKDAINKGEFFLACFSSEYNTRSTTYMNEELYLAIDQLRLQPITRTWFIPVLLSPCSVPTIEIGGSKTLRDIQWVELYKDWDLGIRRIIQVI